jgi:hypothetical protein
MCLIFMSSFVLYPGTGVVKGSLRPGLLVTGKFGI